jgi:hypothetical protein
MFSPIGMVIGWLLAFGVLVPVGLLIIVTLNERVALTVLFLAMWWVAGLTVAHWAIPPARRANSWSEGIAAAGWHIGLSLSFTAFAAWFILFDMGIESYFTARDTLPVIVAAILFTILFGVGLIWLRGHDLDRTVRYGILAGSLGAFWMALGWFASNTDLSRGI